MPHQAELQTPPKQGIGASSATAGKARKICYLVLSLLLSRSSGHQNDRELANRLVGPGATATSPHASRLITLEDSEFYTSSEVATGDAPHISFEVTSQDDFEERPFESLHGTPEMERILTGDSHDDNSTHSHDDNSTDLHDSHDDHESSKPWGSVIGASLLVNVASLIGVVFLLPAVARHYLPCFLSSTKRSGGGLDASGDVESEEITEAQLEAARARRREKIMDLSIPAFACGALLATAVFLIFPESLNLIGGHHDDHSEHGEETAAHLSEEDSHEGHDHGRFLEDSHDGHEEHDDDEAAVAAKFGCSVLGGFLLPIVFGALFPKAKVSAEDSAPVKGTDLYNKTDDEVVSDRSKDPQPEPEKDTDYHAVEGVAVGMDDEVVSDRSKDPQPEPEKDTEHHAVEGVVVGMDYTNEPEHEEEKGWCYHLTRNTRDTIDYRLCATVLIGDAFHNFADGIFIGVAFDLCSSDIAISIMAVTLYHEIAQELADFFILTRHAGLSVLMALCLNFASGLFVMFGGITALAADLSDTSTGVVLAIGAGSYVYISASECLPRVEAAVDTRLERLLAILMFVLGCVPIGLVLLNHQHCEG